MRIVTAAGPEELAASAFDAVRGRYRGVLVDIGCGDGALPYRLAESESDLLCLGVDPNAESMEEYARRAARKPGRGGRENVLYVAASIEGLPDELSGRADLITINFPWAGLRRSLLRGDSVAGNALGRLSAEAARFQLLINVDESDAELAGVTPETLRGGLAAPLGEARFEIDTVAWLPESSRVRSRWGGRLIAGSGRSVVRLHATRGVPEAWGLPVLERAAGLDPG